MFTTDAALVVRTWDPWLADVTGIRIDAALDRKLTDLIPDLASRGLLAAFESALARGTVEVLAPALHHHLIACEPSSPVSGFPRMHQHVTIGPIRNDARITGLVVTIEDVTARVAEEHRVAEQVFARSGHVPAPGVHPPSGEDLARMLGMDAWRDRRTAVTSLAAHGPAIVDSLVETLRRQHMDFSVLSSALDLLAVSDIDIVEPLIGFLDDPDQNLRIQAALMLGERRDMRAVQPLIARLSDSDVNVQFHAIEALGRLCARDAVDALAAVAERRDFFLSFPAIQALSRLGSGVVAPRLVPLLDDELLRAPVVEALGELGDEEVALPLVQLLNSSDVSPDVIADALAGLFDRYDSQYGAGEHIAAMVRRAITPAATQKILDSVQRVGADRLSGLAAVLGWLNGEAVQRALTRLLGHDHVRAQVVEALVRHGSGVVMLLVEQLRAEDLETRQAAATALGRIGDRRATPALVRALDDPEVAVPAAGALARIGDGHAFEPLLARVGHPDAAIRQSAIAALNSIGHADMPARVAVLLDDPNPLVRESATRIAGYFGYPACLDHVLARIGDDSESVRRAAVESLVCFDDSRVVPALIQALQRDSPGIRAAAASGLATLDHAEVVDALIGALCDADAWVRFAAVRALGEIRAPRAGAAVLKTLRQDPAPQVRLAAIDIVGRLSLPEALDLLPPLTRSDDRDVSGAAIRGLAHVESASVLPILERLLRAPEVWRRQMALESVISRTEPTVADTLQWVAAVDDDPDVAGAAVDGLGRIASRMPDGSGATKALLALTAQPQNREAAIRALGLLPLRRVDEIASGLTHASPVVRRATVEALSRMKQPDASQAIETALDDADRQVRLTAVVELRHLGTRTSQRKLMTLARTDPDPDVRRAAMLAVARHEHGDPGVPAVR